MGSPVVEQHLNRKTLRVRGRAGTCNLILWRGGCTPAADLWESVKHPATFPEQVAEYEAAAARHPEAVARPQEME